MVQDKQADAKQKKEIDGFWVLGFFILMFIGVMILGIVSF